MTAAMPPSARSGAMLQPPSESSFSVALGLGVGVGFVGSPAEPPSPLSCPATHRMQSYSTAPVGVAFVHLAALHRPGSSFFGPALSQDSLALVHASAGGISAAAGKAALTPAVARISAKPSF